MLMGVWEHVPRGGWGARLGVFSTALGLTPPTSVTTVAVTDFFSNYLHCSWTLSIHVCNLF